MNSSFIARNTFLWMKIEITVIQERNENYDVNDACLKWWQIPLLCFCRGLCNNVTNLYPLSLCVCQRKRTAPNTNRSIGASHSQIMRISPHVNSETRTIFAIHN